MMLLSVLAAILTTFAVAYAQEDCLISSIAPVVSDWTMAGRPGGLTITAKLAARLPGLSPAEFYLSGGSSFWWHSLYVRPSGSTDPYDIIDTHDAAVTDTTFQFDLKWPSGVYEYLVHIGGSNGEFNFCDAYDFHGEVMIEDPTPVRSESWGQVKGRWSR